MFSQLRKLYFSSYLMLSKMDIVKHILGLKRDLYPLPSDYLIV